ncbi:MAG: energy-coupling factor transporter transmembrane component T [Propionicimonas sp.]|nr:energy-coupling factor transporter transmembrane component T [Propionicimonas sp.]
MHPWAWWAWAVGLAVAASGTTNPLLLVLIAAAVVAVVLLRRGNAPWARSLAAYAGLAVFIIAMRLTFQVLLGAGLGSTVLFTLPEIPLPDWAAGIRLGGAVTAESLLYGFDDALRIAVMLLCVGAANALANPRQALRSVPAALYEASVAVVIALSVAPQLIESAQRVRKARRLRGRSTRGLRGLATIVIPVLGDAIDRSIALAAGMEARGFARTRRDQSRGTLPVMLVSSSVALVGVFLLLSTSWAVPALLTLAAGVAGTAWGLRRAGRRLQITHYRPQPWGLRDTGVALCGALVAVTAFALVALSPGALTPSTDPLAWPELTWGMLVMAALGFAPIAWTVPRRVVQSEPGRRDSRVRSLRPRAEPELVDA